MKEQCKVQAPLKFLTGAASVKLINVMAHFISFKVDITVAE